MGGRQNRHPPAIQAKSELDHAFHELINTGGWNEQSIALRSSLFARELNRGASRERSLSLTCKIFAWCGPAPVRLCSSGYDLRLNFAQVKNCL